MIDQKSRHLLDDLPVRIEAALVGDSQHAAQLTEPGVWEHTALLHTNLPIMNYSKQPSTQTALLISTYLKYGY